jgi:hypothetical protein
MAVFPKPAGHPYSILVGCLARFSRPVFASPYLHIPVFYISEVW